MNKAPLISIIVPVYNSEEYLGKCLDCLILQTYDNLEIICINDGSEDGSRNLLKKYAQKDSRIKVINQENSGQSHARNVGLDIAKGEYISFIDSDDWASLSLYKKFVNALNETDGAFDTYMFNYTFYVKKPNINDYIGIIGIQPERWRIYSNHISTFKDCSNPFAGNMGVWNKIYSKKLLDSINLRFEENYIFEDHLFYLKAFLESKGMYIDFDIQYFYRQNEISTVHNLGGNAFDIFRIFGLMEDVFKEKNIYDIYKYGFLQHKFQEYTGFLFRINKTLRKDFYAAVKQNLIETTKEGFDEEIIKKLRNSKLYFDIISNEFNEFMKIRSQQG